MKCFVVWMLFCFQKLNFKDVYVPRGVTYHDYSILMDTNPIKTALNVCKDLIAHRVSKLFQPISIYFC